MGPRPHAMSPSRRGDSGRPRTAEERERDRLERERRRARERGSSSPAGDDAVPLFDSDGAIPYPLDSESPYPLDSGPPYPADSESPYPLDPVELPVETSPPAGSEAAWSQPLAPDYPAADPAPPAPGFDDPRDHPEGSTQAYDVPGGFGGEGGPAAWVPPEEAGDPGAYDPYDGPGAYDQPAGAPGEIEEIYGPPPPASPPAPAGPGEGGVRGALGRASSGLAGAAASARAGAKKRRAGEPKPEGRAKTRAGSSAGSLAAARRARPARRAPGAGVRPRPGARVNPLTMPKRTSTTSGEPRSRRGRIAAVIALAAVVFALWFLFSLFQPFKGAGTGSVAVDIPRGASSSTIGTLLADRGVISSAFFFKLRTALSGKRSQLESGHFDLKRNMSYGSALDALTSHQGRAATISVTIPEGLSRTEIAPVATRAGVTGDYVKASVHSHLLKPRAYGAPASAHSLEGFLFPATYDLLPGDPASKLVNAQLTAFKSDIAKVDLSRARAKHLTTYDVLTIASMVEREAERAAERPLIAAVIYNRLRDGMPLGIDATLRYALNDYAHPLTVSQLRLASPYNTRTHKGLPPTPIGNPGLASIVAAAHPAAVPYLYYVVKPGVCGEHAFSTTFAQFQQDAARYNSARTAKGGKSPTSCAK
ncbi:MAG: hypothetical protein QOE44_991 [Solirubrobacteraceae bacterium]|nr:hypothetical protein [Solirubrobacteraceae bacterium]